MKYFNLNIMFDYHLCYRLKLCCNIKITTSENDLEVKFLRREGVM